MSRPSKDPAYRLHKASGQAVVRIAGHDHYLGKHGSLDSHSAYVRVLTDWKSGLLLKPSVTGPLTFTVNELCLRFLQHADRYYRDHDGGRSNEFDNFRLSLRPLIATYGRLPVDQFGPLRLQAVRDNMVTAGLARGNINSRVRRIKAVFAWGVANELVPSNVLDALRSVKGLAKGRTTARETAPVRPVADAVVTATLPHVSRQVAAMIQLQRLTGMRPGEVCLMRTCDIDRSGPVWLYRPHHHKTEHRGRTRAVAIGPRAQSVLTPWLRVDAQAHLFQPREAEADRRDARSASRTTPLSCGNRRGTNATPSPRKSPGTRYTTQSYGKAIMKGCEAAFKMPDALRKLPRSDARRNGLEDGERKARLAEAAAWRAEHCWHPHQLRHTRATEVRRQFGLDAAQVLLGHASANVTEVYAELDFAKAADVAARTG